MSEFILLFFSGQVESAGNKKEGSAGIKNIGHSTEFVIVSFGHIFGCEMSYLFLSPESPVIWIGYRRTPV